MYARKASLSTSAAETWLLEYVSGATSWKTWFEHKVLMSLAIQKIMYKQFICPQEDNDYRNRSIYLVSSLQSQLLPPSL